jgi:hypothetical protein
MERGLARNAVTFRKSVSADANMQISVIKGNFIQISLVLSFERNVAPS